MIQFLGCKYLPLSVFGARDVNIVLYKFTAMRIATLIGHMYK